MSIGSKINPNFPVPGLDQSSKGFRDNFAAIKTEIEELQNTSIQLIGAVSSNLQVIGTAESGVLVINTSITGDQIILTPYNHAIQFNQDGALVGDAPFVYLRDTGTVGIGTSIPSSAHKIDVRGPGIFHGDVYINNHYTPTQPANLIITTDTTTAHYSVADTAVTLGSITATPLHIQTTNKDSIIINTDGNVGIGTSESVTALTVLSKSLDIGHWLNYINNIDSMVRAATTEENSSISWGLDHTWGNWAGGMRFDRAGTLSLHTGENSGAQLSRGSARINIDNNGKVGIGSWSPAYTLDVNGTLKSSGITDITNNIDGTRVGINNVLPNYELDIIGDAALNGALISTVPVMTIDPGFQIIDAWPVDQYRTGRYTIQMMDPVTPNINVIDYVVTHLNGSVIEHQTVLTTTVGTVGTISANLIDGYVEVVYTTAVTGSRVTFSKTYLLA